MSDEQRVSDEQLAEWDEALLHRHRVHFRTPEERTASIARQAIAEIHAARAREAELQDAVEHQRGRFEREHNTVHELQQRIDSGLAGVSALEVDARRKVQTDTPYPTVHAYLDGVHDAYLVALKTLRAALTGTQSGPDQVAADQGRTGLGKD